MRRRLTHASRGRPEIPALTPRSRRLALGFVAVLTLLLIGFTFVLLPTLGP